MSASYTAFMIEVDAILIERVGLDHMDLPDFTWRDMYESDVTPEQAVDEYMESEYFP